MQSEQIDKLAAALAKAQGAIRGAVKDRTNPHFKQAYATLASVWDACREPLSANGLAVVQVNAAREDGKFEVVTTLMHASGQWVSGSLVMTPQQNTPQGLGSTMTYARRYALAAMVGVAPDDDDDGNAASSRPAPQTVQQMSEPAPDENRFQLMGPNGRVASRHPRPSLWLDALETEMRAAKDPHVWWAINGSQAKQIAEEFPDRAAARVAELEEIASHVAVRA